MSEKRLHDLPSARELGAAAQAANHDALGLSHDPELLVPLVNAARHRAFREQTPEALADWATLLHRYVELFRPAEKGHLEDPAATEWLGITVLAFGCVSQSIGFAAPEPWIEPLLEWASGQLPRARRLELKERFRFELESGSVKGRSSSGTPMPHRP